jgi:phosphatidylserine/phosphatidylglycerophosphate/cardiolipin synthase-like enzyme
MYLSSIDTFSSLMDTAEEIVARAQMIRRAERFVYCSAYFYRYNEHVGAFYDSVIDALRRGVYVCLINDDFGQRISQNVMAPNEYRSLLSVFSLIKQLGGDVFYYRPAKKLARWLGAGYHIKIQVSDKEEVIFGSGNISANGETGWREYSVHMRGQIARVLLADLMRVIPADLRRHDRFYKRNKKISQSCFTCNYITFDPNVTSWKVNPVTEFLKKKIASAQKSIDVSSFYFKPEKDTLKQFVEAAKRGVRIRVFHSARTALPTSLPWLPSLAMYPELLGNGVEIFESKTGEHSKIMIVDDANVSFGSYNFERAAHFLLAESMLYTEGRPVIEQARCYIERFFDSPYKKIDSNEIKRSFIKERLKMRLLYPVLRYI